MNITNIQNSIKSKNLTQLSYRTTYYFLILATIISFSASFFLKSNKRNILWIETLITSIASSIYYLYNKAIDNSNLTHKKTLGWQNINKLRYLDWAFTTPLMLISLMLLLSINTGIKINIIQIIIIVILDWIMLAFGYLGEMNIIQKKISEILGFIPFIIIFYILYITFINGKNNLFNNILFIVYFLIWASYGILYMFDEKTMNMIFNILDCISKAFVSFFITGHLLLN